MIHLDRIHKVYHTGTVDVHALHGISLSISRGEFVSIMGPSGSGKSTMMNIIGCLDRPTRGQYLLEGIDVSTLSKGDLADIRNSKIGFVFQAYNLIARTTCLENVEMPMLYAGVHGAERLAAGPGGAGGGRHPREGAQPAAPALRRAAAAGGHRPGPRHRAGHHPGRRADRQPGHAHHRWR